LLCRLARVAAGALAPSALAQEQKATFGRAAAQVDFPVYRPLRTLGLKPR
jgi:hypothetical protein